MTLAQEELDQRQGIEIPDKDPKVYLRISSLIKVRFVMSEEKTRIIQ